MNNNKERGLLPFVIIIFLMLACVIFAQQTYNLEIIFHTECPVDSAEYFGVALSSAGDVNDDGYDDIMIGSTARFFSGMQDSSHGHAYIYCGGPVMDTVVDISLPGEHPLDAFGASVCNLGDVNCDSVDDIAVGAVNCTQIDSCGRVYIYFGSSSMDSIPDLVLKGDFCTAFGVAITAGDINGDGWNDIIVGEYAYNWLTLDGRAYIYYGGPLLDTIPDIILNGHNSECFGHTIGSGGDLNSDGFEDVVVGADENSESYGGAGKVYAFFGGNPMDTVPDCWLHGEGVNHYLGWYNVSIADNVTSFDRMTTSTWHYSEAGRSGKIYVLYGGSPMDTILDVWMVGYTDSSGSGGLGYWSATANKADGDNYADVLGGAPGYNNGTGYLWLGALSMDTTPDGWLSCGNSGYRNIGDRVASAGDVNGDGFDEVMFSNYAADSNKSVWVCRYTGPGVVEQRTEGIAHIMAFTVYPTIFTDKLVIKCQIPNDKYQMNAKVQMSLKIYDILGREVIKYDIENPEGKTVVDVDARHLSAGVYFIQVEVEGIKEVQKVIKLK
ncbi:MAG TPA: T9SS type A sorting domain-containing protein [bacterium]